MSEETLIEGSIIAWVNSFFELEHYCKLSDLNDGIAFLKILDKVDQKLWNVRKAKNAESKERKYKLYNLKYIFKGIQKFNEVQLGIKVPNEIVDLKACSELTSDINGRWMPELDSRFSYK